MEGVVIRTKGEVVIVDLNGEIDFENADQFLQVIEHLVNEGKLKILVNFSSCNYIDSSGLGAIIQGHRLCQKLGEEMKLCNMNEDLKEIVSIAGMDRFLKLFATEDEAMASFCK